MCSGFECTRCITINSNTNILMIQRLNLLTTFLLLIFMVSCKPNEPEIKADGIKLNKDSLTISAGDSTVLIPAVSPSGAKPKMVWTSSNEKVVTVSDGKIKALARGSATIKVIADSVFSATCAVVVNQVDLPYQLVWFDEFDGTTLDQTKWSFETGGGGWGNQEKEYYTNRSNNLRVENGNLVIEALKETYQTSSYTSARINTRDKFSFAYGKIEARISLPSGKGTWPAFWMMGSSITYSRWPLCGEIDIMEHIGSDPTMTSHAVHTYEMNGSKGNNWYSRKYSANMENSFHTYGIEWEQKYNEGDDCMSFYVDGVKSATIWEPHVNSTTKNWPFKSDFFVLLNLAIGGTMGGTVDDNIFAGPVQMKVDYVRVYQRK